MMTVGLVVGKSEPGRGLPLTSASRMFIIRAGEEGALSWGPPPRGQRPAPSLSVRGRRAFAVRGAVNCRMSGSPACAASGAASYRWGGAWLPVRRTSVGRAVRGPGASRSFLRRRLHQGSHNTSYTARAVFVF
jgi:hypothetical protein